MTSDVAWWDYRDWGRRARAHSRRRRGISRAVRARLGRQDAADDRARPAHARSAADRTARARDADRAAATTCVRSGMNCAHDPACGCDELHRRDGATARRTSCSRRSRAQPQRIDLCRPCFASREADRAALLLAGVIRPRRVCSRTELPALRRAPWCRCSVFASACRSVARAVSVGDGVLALASCLRHSPWLKSAGFHGSSGPERARAPVLSTLDVTTEELRLAGIQRRAAGFWRRSASAWLILHARSPRHAALLAPDTGPLISRAVTQYSLACWPQSQRRLVPTLERDAKRRLVKALRDRGLAPHGLHGPAARLSPVLPGSLEAQPQPRQAMEARGFGRPGRTRLPASPWRAPDLASPSPARSWRSSRERCGSSGAQRADVLVSRRRPRARRRLALGRASGEVLFLLLGPSGSGKSTVLRALAGLRAVVSTAGASRAASN